MSEFVTHDVKRFIIEKPTNLKFIPGQAAHISINNLKWKNEKRPFTFTGLNEDLVLEFIIKSYSRGGVTEQLHKLSPRDELVIHDIFGAINYKGRGVFIAGGAGITPFIAILRQLQKDRKLQGNKLIFSNKTSKDVILEKEFKEMLGENLILTLTEERNEGYEYGMVNEEFLKKHIKNFNQKFYICGPLKMVEDISGILEKLNVNVDFIVFE